MMTTNILIEAAPPAAKPAIVRLLHDLKLPYEDLEQSAFYIATADGELAGVAGLEIHGEYGLLRSVAVDPAYRNQKIADQLIRELEKHAKQNKLASIFLLTETAPKYFSSKGFQVIQRNEVPAVLQQSSEFSHVCPASAIVMKKTVDA